MLGELNAQETAATNSTVTADGLGAVDTATDTLTTEQEKLLDDSQVSQFFEDALFKLEFDNLKDPSENSND